MRGCRGLPRVDDHAPLSCAATTTGLPAGAGAGAEATGAACGTPAAGAAGGGTGAAKFGTPGAAAAPGVQMEVIPIADHFFGAGLADISRIAADWLG